MRRNMQEVLERWGRWAASEEKCTSVDWPAMSVPVIPPAQRRGAHPVCSDDDGLIIDGCVARLGKTVSSPDDMLILGMRFIGGLSLRQIAVEVLTTVPAVRKSLGASEAFLAGCLAALDVPLDMDPEVIESKIVVCAQKPVLCS